MPWNSEKRSATSDERDLIFVVADESLDGGDIFGGRGGELKTESAARGLERHDIQRGRPGHHGVDGD